MGTIPHDQNTGPSTTPNQDEETIANSDTGLATTGTGSTTGVEESATDFGIGATADPQIDLSLTSGINVDSVFSLAGTDNPFGDLSISGLTDSVSGIFGSNFSIDDIAEQFGIGGLLGNLPIAINTNVAPKLYPNKNILHNYATHTYRLTLGAQDIRDHKEVSDVEFTRGTPKITTVLMTSGAARTSDGVERDPIFKEDFFIEDLKMTTVIGNTAKDNGSNSVGLSFTIFEPYAVSLIERLIALANKLGYTNYIEIPFIFKIEFIGYNDSGQQVGVVPLTTKYIPFRLTYMKFVIDGKGSKYDCTAIPMNHFTYNQTVAAIPEAVEVSGGTLGSFFNGENVPVGAGNNNTSGGLVNAVNGFHAKLAQDTGVDAPTESTARNAADKIVIKIHPDIAEHKLEIANLAKVGMINPDANFDPSRQHPQPAQPLYGFHAGTSILSIIDTMIKESTFMTNQIQVNKTVEENNAQLQDSEKDRAQEKNPLIMPKITARYTMLEYDTKANRHAYQATYIISPFETAGHQSPSVSRSEIENIAKEYDYLFTGKNQDILDIDIKFDLAFYNNVATNTKSVSEGTPSGNNKTKVGDDPGDGAPQQSDPLTLAAIESRPPESIENVGSMTKEDIKKIKASALMKSVMQDSAGDMITLDITILGDPAFIKQDDILYAPEDDNSNAFTENGSIKQDTGDMYLRLRFKAFDDIDHVTGLRVEGRQIPDTGFARKSTFDGFYRILMLDNIFQGGQFTQNLVVVRTYTQETDDPESDINTTLDSNLISFGADGTGLGEFGDTPTQAVEEAKQIVQPQTQEEFIQQQESIIQNPPVTADTIVSLGNTTAINAEK